MWNIKVKNTNVSADEGLSFSRNVGIFNFYILYFGKQFLTRVTFYNCMLIGSQSRQIFDRIDNLRYPHLKASKASEDDSRTSED